MIETLPMRTVIVGDIHGCADELHDLLRAAGLHDEDRLVTLGDTIVKGPSPREVLDFLTSRPNTTCLLGNMEWQMLEATRGESVARLSVAQRETLELLGPDWPRFREMMVRWPLHVAVEDLLCLHAGIRPGRPLDEQTTYDLLHIRTVRGRVGACGTTGLSRPWHEFYEGPPTIVFGHQPRSEPLVARWAIGLDTGCVYGGALSALLLPGRRVVQVAARRAYAAR